MPKAKVLITVKTYPLPTTSHGEVVCTAGLLENGKWIRIYPILFRFLSKEKQFKKYHWIEIDLVKLTTDFRPESYHPKKDVDQNLKILNRIGTKDGWKTRKKFVLKEVFYSFDKLISLAREDQKKSLATLKPLKIIGFDFEEDEREWKPKWKARWAQLEIFDKLQISKIIKKVPYKFYYKFLSEGDKNPRKLMIEDWEIGALYWNCLKQTNGNELESINLVKKKYFDEFALNKDLYFFVGTNFENHLKNYRNPFIIIGLFYPPRIKENHQLEILTE
ncbi:MAG: hypothetical protein KAW92_01230 [Candidatus Cloacimonetes bacterium]|nr:hypothetical protein [Candidatus Cloacimonadota bacterium]